ncbi:sensor histidine kinase [Desulfosarcina ovata]|uniref:histidine kinase n=1 Tax=Desulfosarcina ovata subsp. ovata TaxID=2752305 RepID=A0A5K8A9C5_9BACT|nr:HAMP domain-containing sensor histidine kinase [Desulfosarcina ovata]BBO89048.1 hypothetical protein DSCOOX_22280 [Desulfosarcina ovata subsp. ovata]
MLLPCAKKSQIQMKNPPSEKKINAPEMAGDRFFDGIDVEFIIHELKDPISVIETALRMLLERREKYGPLTAKQEKTLVRALRSSKKARGLMADLLEVGRADAGCLQCCRFNALAAIDQALAEALETTEPHLWETLGTTGEKRLGAATLDDHGIAVVCSASASDLELLQDENKFRQIVGNLIKNALQYRRRRLDITLGCYDGRIVLEVADDGPGVEKENHELIFKCYTRVNACSLSSRSSHGLGLAGARVMARRLGGDITLKAGRSTGATFCLSLPMVLELPLAP